MPISIIYGPMFSGKTKKLIERISRCEDKHRLVFKHANDSRTDNTLSSHDPKTNDKFEAIPIRTLYQIEEYLHKGSKTLFVFVDEIQFFPLESTAKMLSVLSSNYPEVHFIFAGLNLTWQGKAFPVVRLILGRTPSRNRILCQGTCSRCGEPSTNSYLIEHKLHRSVEVVGGAQTYEPRCNPCFSQGMKS